MKKITEKVKEMLDVSKMEDSVFRFIGIDVKNNVDKIEITINANST